MPDKPEHNGVNTTLWQRGCRCKPCRQAHSAAVASARERARNRAADAFPQGIPHGTLSGYDFHGCRCRDCSTFATLRTWYYANRHLVTAMLGNGRRPMRVLRVTDGHLQCPCLWAVHAKGRENRQTALHHLATCRTAAKAFG